MAVDGVAVGAGVMEGTIGALSVASGVSEGVGKSMIVGVGVGVMVVLCCSRVWVTSESCCRRSLDCEKRKTVTARATPLTRSNTTAISEPKAEPPFGLGMVAGIGEAIGSSLGAEGGASVGGKCWVVSATGG